jgi:predicted Zn-dependent protease
MAAITAEQAYQQALVHRETGRLAEAEVLLRQIVAVQPGHTNAWHQLGLVVLTTGRAAESLELLGRAIAQSPGNAYYY